MPDFDVSKILIVLVFLAVLITIQIVLKRSKYFKLGASKSMHLPLKVINTLALSKFSSATVIECAEQSFLVVSGRNGSPVIVELPKPNQSSTIKAELEDQ